MNKKTLGWFFLFIAILFINPIPTGVDDIVPFYVYSMYSGIEINLDNISTFYLDYIIFSTIIGLGFLLLAMHFLNWSWKGLFKKIGLGKYKIALLVGVAVVGLIAYLNVQGNLPYLLMGLVSFCYYLFVRKDKSETLAVFLTPFILFWFGLADILSFVFQKIPIPETLDLNNHIIWWISDTLGFYGITNVSLIISVLIGFILVFLTTKVLKEKF